MTAPSDDREPIYGWKAIGAYINKTDRHAQRLEQRGLPVHRRQHLRPSVYAYAHELDQWLADTQSNQHPTQSNQDETRSTESAHNTKPAAKTRLPLILASLLLLALATWYLWPPSDPSPHEPITRAQFIIHLVEALRQSGQGPDHQPVQWPANCSITFFQDIDDDHPLAHDCRLAYAIQQRILEGNREGETLDPDLPIMRIEAARLLMLGVPALRQHHDQHFRHHEDRCRLERICISITELQGTEEFLDVPTFPTYQDGGWYYYHVYAITELGIISPKTTFRFDPTGGVVRQEMEEWIAPR